MPGRSRRPIVSLFRHLSNQLLSWEILSLLTMICKSVKPQSLIIILQLKNLVSFSMNDMFIMYCRLTRKNTSGLSCCSKSFREWLIDTDLPSLRKALTTPFSEKKQPRNYLMFGFMLFITLFVLFMPISLAGFNLISYICNENLV